GDDLRARQELTFFAGLRPERHLEVARLARRAEPVQQLVALFRRDPEAELGLGATEDLLAAIAAVTDCRLVDLEMAFGAHAHDRHRQRIGLEQLREAPLALAQRRLR